MCPPTLTLLHQVSHNPLLCMIRFSSVLIHLYILLCDYHQWKWFYAFDLDPHGPSRVLMLMQKNLSPTMDPSNLLFTFTIWKVHEIMATGMFRIKDCSFPFHIFHLFAALSNYFCFITEVLLHLCLMVTDSLSDLLIKADMTSLTWTGSHTA